MDADKKNTLDEVVAKASVSKAFREAYGEGLLRLRLAIQIKGLRLQSNLTQNDLAELSDMPQSVIARIESGKHTISLNTLNKIAQALGQEIKLGVKLGGTITHTASSGVFIESPYKFPSPVTNNNINISFKHYEK